jgi:Lauroyl/myristoyl acyltransferase
MAAKNIEAINKYYDEGRHVVLLLGHIAAWEFGAYKMSIACKHKSYGIVSLITNSYMNRLVQRTRGKMGMELIPMSDIKNFFFRKLHQPSLIAFIGDQSPSNPNRAYWTRFFNRDTGFFTGAEYYARRHNCVVVYPKIVQVKRGYYEAELIEITNNPNSLPANAITENFVRLLEKQIQEHPADWLWSHKRWKHPPPTINKKLNM